MDKSVKILMSWNIRPGREENYTQFITQEFSQALMKANFYPTEAWYTIYGDWPEVTMGFMAEDLDLLQDFLASLAWAKLKHKLFAYIKNYRQKVVPARRGFQI